MKYATLTLVLCFATWFHVISQISFTDMTIPAGLSQVGLNYGVATADFNNDGFDDIFATRMFEQGTLHMNNGDGSFSDITVQAGIFTAPTAQFAVWGDVNNDGWLDLFLGARDDNNALYVNNQDGTFTDIASSAGVSLGGKVKAALFADVDMDGWLDIYVARLGLENILYRNNGTPSGAGITFSDFTAISGATDPLISMGAVFFDYDNDGDPDLYLTHDANIPNILYRNNGNGTFANVSVISGANVASMAMGVDVGDINNDGWLDIYITNLGSNTLLLNNGNGYFYNITQSAGVGDPGMGWGCSFFDFDNDGWQDIYMANDSYFSPFPNLLYRNNCNPTPAGVTYNVVSENTVLHSMEGGYGFGCFDYNNDGLQDIYLANYGGTIGNQLFKNNEANGNNWLKVKVIGVESNAAGIGARVQLKIGNLKLTEEVVAGSGWASQNSLVQHFGLGVADVVDLVTVRWPSGIIDSFENVAANQLLEVTEGESDIIVVDPPDPTPAPDTLAWIEPIQGPTPTEDPTSVEEQATEQAFELWPNPASQYLYLRFNGMAFPDNSLKIRLFHADGQAVDAEIVSLSSVASTTFRLDATALPTGLYVLQVIAGGEVFNKVFLKN